MVVLLVEGGFRLVGQELKGLLRRGARSGREHVEVEADVAGQRERLVRELNLPDDGMVHLLGAGGVVAHVVRGPPDAELLTAGGQLAHEIR
jgi:hypothetical protein